MSYILCNRSRCVICAGLLSVGVKHTSLHLHRQIPTSRTMSRQLWTKVRQARSSPVVFQTYSTESQTIECDFVCPMTENSTQTSQNSSSPPPQSFDALNIFQYPDMDSRNGIYSLRKESRHLGGGNGTTNSADSTRSASQSHPVLTFFSPKSVPNVIKNQMLDITRQNMEPIYGEWDQQEKYGELFDEETMLYICIMEQQKTSTPPQTCLNNETDTTTTTPSLVAFCAYLYDKDNYKPVLYLYELQTRVSHQRQGLGRWLVHQLAYNAQFYQMDYFKLTVQKKNPQSIEWYKNRLGFSLDETDPSKFGNTKADYFILSLSTVTELMK